jgi:hypothetical protein
MSIYPVKKFVTKTIKGYKIANIKDLKQGKTYYTKDPYTTKMNNKWVFDPEYQKEQGLLSYYLRDIEWQIENKLVWVKL